MTPRMPSRQLTYAGKWDLNDTRDLVLGYSGGSGGFILLHILLLSGLYSIVFKQNVDLQTAIDQQWTIRDHNTWKKQETWPDNLATACSQPSPCIFFYCNPDLEKFCLGHQDENIKWLLQSYNDVRADAWPIISSFEEYINLEPWIQSECEKIHKIDTSLLYRVPLAKKIWLYTDVYAQNRLCFYKKAYIYEKPGVPLSDDLISGVDFDGRLVNENFVNCMIHSDDLIYLQDFVNNPEMLVTKGLLTDINSKQLALLSWWKKLHPQDLLQDIGIHTART